MNKIYKVIWSKTKQRYVVVSELAHSCAKRTGRTLGKSAAALMAVLALTAGIGFLPVQAENVDKGQDNYISGDKNVIHGNSNNVFGDDNAVEGNSNTIHGDNSIIEGNDNWMNPGENNLIKGNNNQISAIDNSKVIGDNVTIVNGKDSSKEDSDRLHSITVIGDDVQIGHFWGDAPGTGSSGSAAGDNITVIGDHVQVDNGSNRTDSSNSLIYGNNVSMVNSQNSVAIGNELSVIGTNDVGDNISIGHNIALGGGNNTSSTHSMIAMGNDIQAYGQDNILFGNNIDITENDGITGVIVMGTEADATGSDGVAIGTKATSDGSYALAFGGESTATGTAAIAIGKGEVVSASYGTGLGAYATIGSKSDGSTALGSWASIGEGSTSAIAIGGAQYNGGAHATIGDSAVNSIAIGAGSSVANGARNTVVLGAFASANPTGTWTSNYNGVAIGYSAEVNGQSGTAIGDSASAAGSGSIAIGEGATAASEVLPSMLSNDTIAIGHEATAGYTGGIALGKSSKVDYEAKNGIALGVSSQVGAENSVAVGYKSAVVADDILDAGDVLAAAWRGSDYNQNYIAFDLNSADTNGVISVGSVGSPRRMINIARGRISADSTDAINGSQLFGAVQYLDGRIDAVENKIAGGVGGGDVTIDGDTNIDVTETPDSTTDPGTGGDTENPGTAGDNSQNFEVSMTDNPQFGGHDDGKPGHSADGSVTVVGSGGNEIALNKGNEGGMTVTSGGHTVNINKGGDGLVNGLMNTTWDWSKYEEGGYKGSDNAATESQLHGAVSGIKTEITNMGDQITNMGSQITNIGNKVGELDSRIDEVGAGAAALAALHPLDFDPDDKWDFAAGYGNYRGENAVAIGAFYRPNEDTMFSVGGTVGNDDNMVNAGVSFKIGQGNGVSTSRVAMAKEIKDLRKELEAMKSAMLDVNAGRRLDTSKLQLFPDVPQNHWAYEYVATLAGNGVIEGYPDGNFDGARPMTRYEFAAMLYRAMLNGAKLSDKILTEFAPELERFTVDVVHKDSDGNPTVERVRVVKRNDTAK